MQSSRDLIQGDLGKFRDGTNRNFKKFSKEYNVLHLGQSNSTVANINTHEKQTGSLLNGTRVMIDTRLNISLECALLTNKQAAEQSYTWRSKTNRKKASSLISLALVKPHLAKLVLGLPDQEGCGETGKSPKDGYTDGQYIEFQQEDVKGSGIVWYCEEQVKKRPNCSL